jgi:hypothetical protein
MKHLKCFNHFFYVGFIGLLLILSSCSPKDERLSEQNQVVAASENMQTGKAADTDGGKHFTDEAKSCEQIHDSKKADTIQGNQIDLARAKIGDKILGLTIAEITNKIQGITDGEAVSVRLCGNMKVSGTFVYHKNHEYFPNVISFIPDPESLQKIPFISSDGKDRKPLIVFQQVSGAVKEKLGDPEASGTATFEIANYTIRRAASEIWDTAEVLDISNINKHIAAVLPDGTPLFENQIPVKWGKMSVQIINNGSGRPEKSVLKSDVTSQVAYGTDGSGVEVSQQEVLEVNSKKYILAFAKQNSENKYILLDYVPHPTEKEVKMIYSIVVTTDEQPETVKKFLVPLVKTWNHKPDDEDDPSRNQPRVKQAPFSLPNGYQAVETTSFKFAIPNDWQWEKGDSSDSILFQKDGKKLGETETLAWFHSEETWKNIKPNHSEQTDFQEIKDLISIECVDAHVYKIQLTHTKPAADLDPDWKYEETRWYVTVEEKNRSYGLYFNSGQVDESTMKTIISTFRLNI